MNNLARNIQVITIIIIFSLLIMSGITYINEENWWFFIPTHTIFIFLLTWYLFYVWKNF